MKMESAKLVLAVLTALVMLVPLSFYAVVKAQDTSSYTGLDVVFLIDQSGSMGGEAFRSTEHPQANDRLGLRFYAPQFAMDWLGFAYLDFSRFEELPPSFRVAAINFGTTTERVLEPSSIAPESKDIWTPQREALKYELSGEEFGFRNLDYTDFKPAFEEARRVFDEMAREDPSPRLKAIIVLTDGEPCVRQPPEWWEGPTEDLCQQSQFHKEYMARLAEYTENAFPYPEHRIYTVALNDRTRKPLNLQRWQAITHNNAYPALTEQEIGDLFQDVLGQLSAEIGIENPEPKIECGNVPIDPYLEYVRFTFHKSDPKARVQIYIPHDSLLPLDVTGDPKIEVSGIDGPIETVDITDPTPGTWRLECPLGTKEPIIRMGKKPVTPRLVKPSGVQGQFVPVEIEYNILDRNGALLEEYTDPHYRLSVVVTVTHNIAQQVMPLARSVDGIYTCMFMPEAVGSYSLGVNGTANSADPEATERLTVFNIVEDTTFSVDATRPALIPPASSATQIVPTTFSVVLEGTDSQPIAVPSDSQYQPRLTLTVRNGDDNHVLTPTLQSDRTYAATFTPKRTGEYAVHLRAVVSDPAGGEVTIADGNIGSVSVGAAVAAWEASIEPQAQYSTTVLAISLLDQTGQPLTASLDPAYQVNAEAVTTDQGKEQRISLTETAKGVFSGEFIPQTAGTRPVRFLAKARNTAGQEVELVNREVHTLNVVPTTLVSYGILSPQDGARDPWRTFYFKPRPFGLEVALLDDQGNPMAPPVALASDEGQPFVVTVTGPDGADLSDKIVLQTSGLPGVWRASTEEFTAKGSYTIHIKPKARLRPAHVWDMHPKSSITVGRTENPLIWVLPSIMAMIVMAVVAWAVHQFQLRIDPARGALNIEDATGMVLQSINLTSIGKNKVVYGRRQLRPITRVRKIIVRHRRKSPGIQVTLIQDNGQRQLDGQVMMGGSRLPLQHNYWLSYAGAGGFTPGMAGDQFRFRG